MLGAKSKPSKPNSSWQYDNLAFFVPAQEDEAEQTIYRRFGFDNCFEFDRSVC